MPELWVANVGRLPYAAGGELQDRVRAARQRDAVPDTLLLLEHDPVYTRGRRTERTDLPMGDDWYRAQGIEVADTSLRDDQGEMLEAYAAEMIPIYWIVNIPQQRIEVYTQPSGPTPVPAYGSFQSYQPGDALPLTLDGNVFGAIPVTDLLR